MSFKILNGTPRGGKPLCTTCRNAVHVKGQNMQEHTLCSAGAFGSTLYLTGQSASILPNLVRYPVAECSKYQDANTATLFEMEKIAWEITARKRGATGFSGATELDVVIEPPKKKDVGTPFSF